MVPLAQLVVQDRPDLLMVQRVQQVLEPQVQQARQDHVVQVERVQQALKEILVP